MMDINSLNIDTALKMLLKSEKGKEYLKLLDYILKEISCVKKTELYNLEFSFDYLKGLSIPNSLLEKYKNNRNVLYILKKCLAEPKDEILSKFYQLCSENELCKDYIKGLVPDEIFIHIILQNEPYNIGNVKEHPYKDICDGYITEYYFELSDKALIHYFISKLKDESLDFLEFLKNNEKIRQIYMKIKSDCERIIHGSYRPYSDELVELNNNFVNSIIEKIKTGEILDIAFMIKLLNLEKYMTDIYNSWLNDNCLKELEIYTEYFFSDTQDYNNVGIVLDEKNKERSKNDCGVIRVRA